MQLTTKELNSKNKKVHHDVKLHKQKKTEL